jgi:S-methylmethionine-dependent homocysteine/selenocysteine methylase
VWLGIATRREGGAAHLTGYGRSDVPLERALDALLTLPVDVASIMHTALSDVDEALDLLQARWTGPVGVYPESGRFEMPDWRFVDDLTGDRFVELCRGWAARGVRVLGGCCGVQASHIRALAEASPSFH